MYESMIRCCPSSFLLRVTVSSAGPRPPGVFGAQSLLSEFKDNETEDSSQLLWLQLGTVNRICCISV